MAHNSYPKGSGGFGSLGDLVDVDFVMNHGCRAQRRRLERHLQREASKEKVSKRKGGKS